MASRATALRNRNVPINRIQGKPQLQNHRRQPLGASNPNVQSNVGLNSKAVLQLVGQQKDENSGVISAKSKNDTRLSHMESKIPKLGLKPNLEPKMAPVEAFSSLNVPPNVDDIDEEDKDNVFLETPYVKDIYKYLRELEESQRVRKNFLSIQKEMTPKMRSVLIDWLINVHNNFKLLPETLYMGVAIVDRVLQREVVSKDKIQLVGVTAFFIASKFEEIYPPDLMDFVVICDKLYSKREIIKMEMVILRVLNFELARPLPLHFLRRNSKAARADARIHTMAKYLMELSLLDHECSSWNPSKVAATAIYVTLKVLNSKQWWSETMAYYSNYTEDEIKPCAAHLCKVLRMHGGEDARYPQIRKKYTSSKQQCISKAVEWQSAVIDELASL